MIAERIISSVNLDQLLAEICRDDLLHAKWLNTISMMEHIGATKIARRQSGEKADMMVLKHAAEEARHAFYLKKLSDKLAPGHYLDYSPANLFAPVQSKQYLNRLDLAVSKILREAGISGLDFSWAAYLLVTWAIEVRADEMYPVYQNHLKNLPVKISVLSIINEEVGHLEEMESAMEKLNFDIRPLKIKVKAIEEALFSDWIAAISQDLAKS